MGQARDVSGSVAHASEDFGRHVVPKVVDRTTDLGKKVGGKATEVSVDVGKKTGMEIYKHREDIINGGLMPVLETTSVG